MVLSVISSQEIDAQKFNPDDILGKWYTDDKGAVVQIYKKESSKYYGKFLWLIDEKDENGNDTYEDGVIYNPKDGNTYSATMKLVDINSLEVRGYLLFEWLGKTVVWSRKEE